MGGLRSLRSLPSFYLLALLTFLPALRTKNAKTRENNLLASFATQNSVSTSSLCDLSGVLLLPPCNDNSLSIFAMPEPCETAKVDEQGKTLRLEVEE